MRINLASGEIPKGLKERCLGLKIRGTCAKFWCEIFERKIEENLLKLAYRNWCRIKEENRGRCLKKMV